MATDEWDDMQQQEDDELNEEPLDDSAGTSGKYDKLLGSDSKRYKLSGMFKDWFLDYSSYVILQRWRCLYSRSTGAAWSERFVD